MECLFFPSSILQPHWPESQWSFSNVPLSQASVDFKITLHTHSKVALFSNPHISSTKTAMNHPCVARLSKNFATCFGFVSSEIVLMSKFAKYIVGVSALPCLNNGFHSSCHSQCFCSKFVIITTANAGSFHRQFSGSFPLFEIMHDAHECHRNGPVLSDPLFRGSVQFDQEENFLFSLNSEIPSGP